MRIYIYIIALLFIFGSSLYAASEDNPPYILIVVADDLAYADIGDKYGKSYF